MLEELHVRDFALIEEAWLEFGPGMTVLSGETGAGKTALVGALKLLVGERADSGSVRAGCAEAFVEGRFSVGDSEIIVKRRVGADGRSRCSIDGEMASVGALAAAVGPLVDLHGQHEHQALLSAQSHLGYLDRWVGEKADAARREYADALAAFREVAARHGSLLARLEQTSKDADYLRFVADEIGRVDPAVGEDESLRSRLPALQHAEKLSQAAADAAHALRGDSGALDRIAAAAASLGRVHGIDPTLDELKTGLDELQTLVDDAGATARSYRDSVEHDPAVLDETLSRLSALSGLVKKYGPTLDDVIARRRDALSALTQIDDGDRVLGESHAELQQTRDRLAEAGAALAACRENAVQGFVAALESATADLAMEGARFEVAMTELPFDRWTVDGSQKVEFMYAPAPGQPARPLARIASGGELSRVMLALKSVLGGADTTGTLVFDEVDAGIGGATATAVGAKLARLAEDHQVLAVTHLAQVAAFADDHFVVTKDISTGDVATSVVRVSGDDRTSEIARMLSGNDSEASRAHASELLDSASPV